MAQSDINEQEPILPMAKTTRQRLRDSIRYLCCLNYGEMQKWSILLLLLAGRIIGIVMYTVWMVDCFLREFRSTPLCKEFVLFPSPQLVRSVWLSLSIGVSLFLIFHVCHRSPSFRGTKLIIRHLMRRMYFYKITFTLCCVLVYDLVVMLDAPESGKTISYVLFMVEKSLAVGTMILLNFLPNFWKDGDVAIKWWLYKLALVIYALECYILALTGSTIAVYKVLTVSQPEKHVADAPDAKAVIALMLLITNNGLRYFLADFFMHKIFDEKVDILGGASTKNIVDSIGAADAREDRRMVPVAT